MRYRRNLPHWHPEGKVLFVTWRLYGSLPPGLRPQRGTAQPRVAVPRGMAGRDFVRIDRVLDRAASGPLWLKEPRIAREVVDTMKRGDTELGHYDLLAYVVMANHVHILLQPKAPLSRITGGIKGVTAKIANQILGRTGQPFWQDESFDHWVRNDEQFLRIRRYIEANPVTAGLVARAENYPWSSACK